MPLLFKWHQGSSLYSNKSAVESQSFTKIVKGKLVTIRRSAGMLFINLNEYKQLKHILHKNNIIYMLSNDCYNFIFKGMVLLITSLVKFKPKYDFPLI